MALSQNLVQKQTQRLIITQELRQSIELLPLSNQELGEKIQQELIENPLLEIKEDTESSEGEDYAGRREEKTQENDDTGSAEEWSYESDYTSQAVNREKSERKQQFMENTLSSPEGLSDHLLWQLRFSDLSPREMEAGEILISSIDNRGFLTQDLTELMQNSSCSPDEARRALECIHQMDPIGCGARNVTETLFVQARILRPDDIHTQEILKQHMDELQWLDYKKIEKKTGLTLDEIEEAIKFIRTLDPFPGLVYSSRVPDYIIPDIVVRERDGNLEVFVNDEWLPELTINEEYHGLLNERRRTGDEDREYLQTRLHSAQNLIRSIKQRKQTLLRVTSAILDFQRDFFKSGPGNLKPLTLREVAETVDLHESTVSRITTNKYVQTRWGVLELKFFFSGSLKGRDGKPEQSSHNIQERIREMIRAEDTKKPLSDQQIAEIMKQQGVDIARRTVAKYRNVLKIPPADKRQKIGKLSGD